MKWAENSPPLKEAIHDRRIVILTGSGGVGKTTLAAATALFLARQGKKVLSFTVDPARRLADALKLENLGADAQRVELPWETDGEMWATQLDVQTIFRRQLRSYAPSEEMAERILENPFTSAFTRAFAGIENYVAASRLHELTKEGEYDVIVVDTAPSVHAIDFIDVPKRITDFLDANFLRWFLMPFKVLRKTGARVLRDVAAPIFGRVERMAGSSLIDDLSTFLRAFEGLYDGLRDRAHELQSFFDDPSMTAFGLVTRPSHGAIRQSVRMAEALTERNLALHFLIVNRIRPTLVPEDELGLTGDRISEAVETLVEEEIVESAAEGTELIETMRKAYRDASRQSQNERESVETVQEVCEEGVAVVEIPRFDRDIHDIEGLVRMGAYLSGQKTV